MGEETSKKLFKRRARLTRAVKYWKKCTKCGVGEAPVFRSQVYAKCFLCMNCLLKSVEGGD